MAAVTTASYPTPRLRRPGSNPSLAAIRPSSAPPSTTILNFFINVTPNTRSTHSFGPLRGPAVVQTLKAEADPIAANDNFFCFPGYSSSPIEESLVAVATAVTWSTWFKRLPLVGADFNANTRGIYNSTGWTQKIQAEHLINGLVPLDQWYLTISVGVVAGAANQTWRGHIVVIEGLSPEALANFR